MRRALKIMNPEIDYVHVITALKQTGIITLLPQSGKFGVIGIDGKEYPVPTQEQVAEIFANNRKILRIKVPQGFDSLELTPMAMPVPHLLELMKAVIIKHSKDGKIFQTRRSDSEPLIPVRINADKQVWVWDVLKKVIDLNAFIYFPREYSADHNGLTKAEVISNRTICAVPGWSVGLVESFPILAEPGQDKVLKGRKKLETGHSPREYLQILQAKSYQGETGKTLEDFIIKFVTRLEMMNEISNDRYDNNSLWCLGQYVIVKQAEVVPTGWWHRDFGRLRLDMHRTGNKLCTRSWGAATTVRLCG